MVVSQALLTCWVYQHDATSHLLVGGSKPISATQTQYTEYVRDAVHGNVTKIRVREVRYYGNFTRSRKCFS